MQFADAGPVIRGMAWLVDSVIKYSILLILYLVIGAAMTSQQSAYASMGVLLIAQFLIGWFYTTLFEAMTGATPGKKIYGLWVVHDNATPITWSGALIRNFLRVVDNLPFVYMVGLTSMLIDNRFRRLGDLAAGTLVIYRDKTIEDHPDFTHDSGQAPPEWLSREERQAVVDFAERSHTLSPARQQELAGVLTHLFDDDVDPVHTLKSWAQWILRGQTDAQSTSV